MTKLSTYPCTFFLRPNGRTHQAEITHIYEEDADWFRANNAKLSMEEDGRGGYIAYADVGVVIEDTPVEAIQLSGGRNCQDTLALLREQAMEILHTHNEEEAA